MAAMRKLLIAAVFFLFASGFPPFITGKAHFPAATNPQPSKSEISQDSAFHLPVRRITDRKIDHDHAPGVTNEYSRSDPSNADGTRLLLQEIATGNWLLYQNISPFRKIRRLGARLGGDNEPRWNPYDPDVFFAFRETSLITCNVKTKNCKTIYDFKRDFPQAEIVGTGSEGEPSEDFRWWTVLVKDITGRPLAVVSFDKDARQIVSKKTSFEYDLASTEINWVSTCPVSGDPIIGWDFRPEQDPFGSNHYGAIRYDKNWNKVADTLADGHADVGVGFANEELLIYQNNANDFVETVNLANSKRTRLFKIPFPFQQHSTLNLHFSANISSLSSRKGWALVVADEPHQTNFSWAANQIFLIQMKAHPKIWRIAYNHNNYTGDYFTECFATISRDGSRIYFESNWGGTASDEYMIELPKDWDKYF